MIIVDVEATGTDNGKHSILSIGALDFKEPSRQFYDECAPWEGAHVMDEALLVNGFTREGIVSCKKSEGEIVKAFLLWALDSEEMTIGGQNPHFDVGFIQAASARNHMDSELPHRVVDLHSICYYHMLKRGINPPLKNKKTDLNSDVIMEYVGISPEPKPHNALNGAIWEAEAFARLIYNKSLFEKFNNMKIPWTDIA